MVAAGGGRSDEGGAVTPDREAASRFTAYDRKRWSRYEWEWRNVANRIYVYPVEQWFRERVGAV